jgi:hypothetical protein
MITKTPILILASPRTGSTVLGEYIKTLCNKNLRYFIEPDYQGPKAVEEFELFSKQSKDFIIKCHLINLLEYDTSVSSYLLEESFKIRIKRKNIVKQVASMYIAHKRNLKWHYSKEELGLVDSVHIDRLHIQNCIHYIANANKILDDAPYVFDMDLSYEDLPTIRCNNYCTTPKPKNYDELLDVIQQLSGAPNKN